MNTQTQSQTVTNISASEPSLLSNAGGALALVVLLILAIGWLARKMGFTPKTMKGSRHISVVENRSLGQRERVTIVEINNKWLVLGVTTNHITCLASLEKPVLHDGSSPPVGAEGEFSSTLAKQLKKCQVESLQ